MRLLLILLCEQSNGGPVQAVSVQTVERACGNHIDMTVAAGILEAGEVALRIPEHLVVTLNRCSFSRTLKYCMVSMHTLHFNST